MAEQPVPAESATNGHDNDATTAVNGTQHDDDASATVAPHKFVSFVSPPVDVERFSEISLGELFVVHGTHLLLSDEDNNNVASSSRCSTPECVPLSAAHRQVANFADHPKAVEHAVPAKLANMKTTVVHTNNETIEQTFARLSKGIAEQTLTSKEIVAVVFEAVSREAFYLNERVCTVGRCGFRYGKQIYYTIVRMR
jgi:hypothetical protein